MKALVIVVLVLLVGIASLGFYRGWFEISTNRTDEKPSTTFTVDREKILSDEQLAKDKVQGLGQRAKEKTSNLTDKVSQ